MAALHDPKFATMPVLTSAQLAAAAAANAATPGPLTSISGASTLPGPLTSSPSLSNLLNSSSSLGGSSLHLIDQKENQYPVTADGYDVYDEIGVGAFATVYRAVVKETGEEVAIKVLDLDQFNTNWDEIRREILVMSLLHHPNVVAIKCSFVDQQDLWIVMPLLQAGSCASIMKQLYPNGFKDEALIATILRETLQGLLYFHKDSRIHRDVKAGNILVSDKGEVQLADFGVAGTLMENGDRKKNRSTFTGTPCWMAPEVMEHTTGYDEKADIWSFGITAMELGYGRAPYAKFQPMKVMLLTLQEEPPTCDIYNDNSYKFSKHYHSLIAKCLRKDPKKRPNARKLLEHKFFKQARDASYIRQMIVSKLPPKERGAKQVLSKEKLASDRVQQQKSKPVSVGSWVFDENDIASVKARAAATAASRRSVDSTADNESSEEDDETSPRTNHKQIEARSDPVVITEQPDIIHFGHQSSISEPAPPHVHQEEQTSQQTSQQPSQPVSARHSRLPSTEQQKGRFFVSEGDDEPLPTPKQAEKIGRFAVIEDEA